VADTVATTWITAAELFYGAERSSAPDENRKLVTQFLGTLRVLPLGLAAACRFGSFKAHLEGEGRRLADADLLIAAVVHAEDACLVTGNGKHYRRIAGLRLEDWIRG